MFKDFQRPAGRDYTATYALLAIALVVNPVLVLMSRPIGSLQLALAVMLSAGCLALSWASWKYHSHLTIPSLVKRLSGFKSS